MTRQWKAVTLPNNVTLIDTPGLADAEIRAEVAKNITEAVKKGGDFKFLFVVTALNGRFKAEDVTTIKLVLDAVPQIGVDEFGIIVNQLEAAEFEGLKKPENQKKFFMPLWAALPKITSRFELLKKDPELSGSENSVKEFPVMQRFVTRLPTVHIDPSAVKEVEGRDFSQVCEDYQTLANDPQRMNQEVAKKGPQILAVLTKNRNQEQKTKNRNQEQEGFDWGEIARNVLWGVALAVGVTLVALLWCSRTVHDTPV